MISPPLPPARRFRFSIGSLLILMAVIAVPLAILAERLRNAKKGDAFAMLVAKGAKFNGNAGGASGGFDLHGNRRSLWQTLTHGTPRYTSLEIDLTYGGNGRSALTDVDLRHFKLFADLETIKVRGAWSITDEGFRPLGQLPKLRRVILEDLGQVKGAFLSELKASSNLEHLSLKNMTSFEAKHLAVLEKLAHLNFLELHTCPTLNDEALAAVELPSGLRGLTVEETPVGDITLKRWLEKVNLEGLKLNAPISRAIAPGLARQTKLAGLTIRNAPLVDADLEFLGNCPHLSSLILTGMPLEGAFLKSLSDESPLMILYLRDIPLSEKNANELRRFSKLATMHLPWTLITGEFLCNAPWPAIAAVELRGTRFSEQGKKGLAEMPVTLEVYYPSNWTALDMRRLTNVSPPQVTQISELYEEEAKANSIQVTYFYSPEFAEDKFDRRPQDWMADLIRLHELGAAEAKALEERRRRESIRN